MKLFRVFLERETCSDSITGQTSRYRVFNVMRPKRRDVVYRCRNGMMAILSAKEYRCGQFANPTKILNELHASGCISNLTNPSSMQGE